MKTPQEEEEEAKEKAAKALAAQKRRMRSDYDGEGDSDGGGDDLADDYYQEEEEGIYAEDWEGEGEGGEEEEEEESEGEAVGGKSSKAVPMSMAEYDVHVYGMSIAKEKAFLVSLASSRRPYTQITPFLRVLLSRLLREVDGLTSAESKETFVKRVNASERVRLYVSGLRAFASSYTLPLANAIKDELDTLQSHTAAKRWMIFDV